MNDNFRHHSDDWSRVPRPEAPVASLEWYYRFMRDEAAQPTGLPDYYTARVHADNHVVTTKPQLSVGLAYVLWLLFGLIGAHYFYINKPGLGVLWLLTGGLLGVGWVIDLFTLKGQVERANRRG